MSKSAVDHMDVRWRVTGTQAWSAPRSYPPAAEVSVDGLERGKQYDFEVRNVSACGAMSVWVPGNYAVPAAPVPPAVAGLTAQSLADGVHLDWNDAPATSTGIIFVIERATAPGGPFTQRALTRASAYTDPETTGTTYYYRVCARDYAGTKGAYSGVVSSSGTSMTAVIGDVNDARSIANTGLNGVLVPNASFELNQVGAPLNVYQTPVGAAVCDDWAIGENGGISAGVQTTAGRMRSGGQSLRINLVSGTNVVNGGIAFGSVWTTRTFPCAQGDTFFVGGYVFRDASASQPAGVTITLRILLRWSGASGYISQDGANYAGGPGGSMTAPIWAVRQAPAGATGYKVSCHVIVSNASGAAITTNSAWCAASFDDLFVKRVIDNQLGLLPVNWASVGSMLTNSPISFSISGTTVTFSVAATTFSGGGISVPFSASAGNVTQTAGTTVTYYLYYRDPVSGGGSKTLNITTNPQEWAMFPDVFRIGSADVTVAAGGGGTGGTGGGGGGFCVCDDMWVDDETQAKDALPGHVFDCCDLPTRGTEIFKRALQSVDYHDEHCVRLTTEDGSQLDCGYTTPFDTVDGRVLRAPQMQSELVLTDAGLQHVASVEWIGLRRVCYFHFGGVSYAAGRRKSGGGRLFSHNGISKP